MATYNKGVIYGWGINDVDYPTYTKVDGVITYCPIYTKWKDMIKRVMCPKYHVKYPTYEDTSVRDEWKHLSDFKPWMEDQVWQGLELDKDILVMGNRVYGPDTCCFVPKFVNSLLMTKPNGRGECPLGVIYRKDCTNRPYTAQVNDGKGNYLKLAHLADPMEAHKTWQLAKADAIETTILRYMLEPCYRQDVGNALYERAEMLRLHAEQGIETTFL